MKQGLPVGYAASAKLIALSAIGFVNPALYFLLFDEKLLEEKRPV